MIRTAFVYPPIPIRTSDWLAWIDGDEEGGHAYGPTEAEAVANLLELLEGRA